MLRAELAIGQFKQSASDLQALITKTTDLSLVADIPPPKKKQTKLPTVNCPIDTNEH